MRTALSTLAGVLGALWLWHTFFRAETGLSAPASSVGSGGTGGAGGALSGSPGSTGGGSTAALAAAIQALAAGVAVPNIRTVTLAPSGAGTLEAVAGESGKRVCVLAYGAMAAGACSITLRSGADPAARWRLDLDSPAGNSGANLATAWPGFLLATEPGDALNLDTTGAAVVSLTYWQEQG